MFPVWRAQPMVEKAQESEIDTVQYSPHVTFSCSAKVPRASLHSKKRRPKRLFNILTASDSRRQFDPKEVGYEWVEYSAPLLCVEEEEDGVCLREEPAPCDDDPSALVCSIDTRQLPQKRKRRPWVSVVIDDMGVDYYMSRRAVRLRPAVTLSYLPYGPSVRDQARAAAAAGHELMVHLPMEPFNAAADAGPNALRSSMTAQQLQRHLHWALSQFDGYVGLNNHMGSLFTSRSPGGMTVVLEELQKRDLFFLDSLTANDSLGQELAAHLGTTFGARDVFLDSKRGAVPAVEARLQEVEELAQKNGHAIAIGHPYEETLEALEKWLPLLHSKGLALMPLKKALLRERKERERAAGEAVLAFTRAKQLRAIQARRERIWRERQAQAVAAELEEQFGDGTVLAWEGLQDPAAVDALRAVLAARQQPVGGFKASLQRLLQAPFLRGKKADHTRWPLVAGGVERDAERLLRKRARAGQLPELVPKPAAASQAQAVPPSELRNKVGLRRGKALTGRSGRRRGAWKSRLRKGEETEAGRSGCSIEAGPREAAQESAAGSLSVAGNGYTDSRNGARQGRSVQPGWQPPPTGKESRRQGASGTRAEGTQAKKRRAVTVASRNEMAGDVYCGLLLTVVLQSRQAGSSMAGERKGAATSGGHADVAGDEEWAGRQQGREDRQHAMQRWLAQLAADKPSDGGSPRSVLTRKRREVAANASSPDDTPPSSRTPSTASSRGPAREAPFAGLEEQASPSRSSSSEDAYSSASEAGSTTGAGQAGNIFEQAARQSAITVAVALAVAMHLAKLTRRTIDESWQAEPAVAPAMHAPPRAPLLVSGAKQEPGPEEGAAEPFTAAELCADPRPDVRAVSLPLQTTGPAGVPMQPPAQPEAPATVAGGELPFGLAPIAVADAGAGSPVLGCNAPAALVARNGLKSETVGEAPLACSQLTVVADDRRERRLMPDSPTGGCDKRSASSPRRGLAGWQEDGTEAPVAQGQTEWGSTELRPAGGAASNVEGQELRDGAAQPALAVLVPPRQAAEGTQGESPTVLRGVDDPAAAGTLPGPSNGCPAEPGSPTGSVSSSGETEWCDAEAALPTVASLLSLAGSDAGSTPECEVEGGEDVRGPLHQYGSTVDGLAKTLRSPTKVAAAAASEWVSGSAALFGDTGAGGRIQKGADANKKYSWWRWTVGCVLGGVEDGKSNEQARRAGLRGSRRVVPLNVVD